MKNQEFSVRINGIHNELMRFANKLTNNYDDAQDLYQETLIKAFKNWDTCKRIENFGGWMKKVMYNTFINIYNKKKRRRNIFEGVTESNCPVMSVSNVNKTETKIYFKEIKSEVDKLGNKYTAPLMMYATGYSYQEISTRLEVPIGTIKSRMNYGRKRLEENINILYQVPAIQAA